MLQKFVIETLASELALHGASWIAEKFADSMHRLVSVKLTNRSSGHSGSYLYDLNDLRNSIPNIEDILGFDFSKITKMTPEISKLITSTAISAVRLNNRSPERFFTLLSLSKSGEREISLDPLDTGTLSAYLNQPVSNNGKEYIFPGLQTYHTIPFGYDSAINKMSDAVKNNTFVKRAKLITESIEELDDQSMFFRNIMLQEENFTGLIASKTNHVHVCNTVTQDFWLSFLGREDDPTLLINSDFYTASAFLQQMDNFIEDLAHRRLSVYEISSSLKKIGIDNDGSSDFIQSNALVVRVLKTYQNKLITLLSDKSIDSVIEFRSAFAKLANETKFIVLNASPVIQKERLNSERVLDIINRDADAINTLTQISDDVNNVVEDMTLRSVEFVNSMFSSDGNNGNVTRSSRSNFENIDNGGKPVEPFSFF